MSTRTRRNLWRGCHLLVFLRVLLETNLGIFTEGNLLLRYISPSTWGNQREVREPSSSLYQRPRKLKRKMILIRSARSLLTKTLLLRLNARLPKPKLTKPKLRPKLNKLVKQKQSPKLH